MVNTIINALIAGVVGAVAFIAVRALLLGAGADCCGDPLSNSTIANQSVIVGDCGCWDCVLAGNVTNCTYNGVTYEANKTICAPCAECWSGAECVMTLNLIPLAVAIVTIVVLFMGLTKMRGV